jgi:hypothetical protein
VVVDEEFEFGMRAILNGAAPNTIEPNAIEMGRVS